MRLKSGTAFLAFALLSSAGSPTIAQDGGGFFLMCNHSSHGGGFVPVDNNRYLKLPPCDFARAQHRGYHGGGSFSVQCSYYGAGDYPPG